jgi:hypothetical protein
LPATEAKEPSPVIETEEQLVKEEEEKSDKGELEEA